MGYRVRVSDDVYKLLHAKACEAGLSVEDLTELCILDGIDKALSRPDQASSRLSNTPKPSSHGRRAS